MLINNMNYLEEVVEASSIVIVGGKHQPRPPHRPPQHILHHDWHSSHCEHHWTVDGVDTITPPADGRFEEHWLKCQYDPRFFPSHTSGQ